MIHAHDYSPLGTDLFGEPVRPRGESPLARRFVVPPFSVLNARDGHWQKRKRAWMSMGLASETGRKCTGNNSWNSLSTNPRIAESNRRIAAVGDGPTIFDPVLCEVVYRWFSAPGAQIVDPFAGGSVRGVVASALGRRYWGGELRGEQVAANRAQTADLCHVLPPEYVCGDSMTTLADAPRADLVFSCPPYGDLERYSDDPADLSAMDWHAFCAAYRQIVRRACERLRDNRFACFVVGDFRDKRGLYRDFPGETIRAFREAGLPLYNEAILVTAVGSASMRVTKQFDTGRKLCKTHQNVLVFVQGDPRKAAEAAKAADDDGAWVRGQT